MAKPTSPMVIYRLDERDVAKINKRRTITGGDFNDVEAGDEYPAIVVRGFDSCANLKVILDGDDDLWVCSRSEGVAYGQYRTK